MSGPGDHLFKVIVELFPTEWSDVYRGNFINEQLDDRKKLRSVLKSSKGIYAFYNSEFEIVYLGKTKNDLWTEMKAAYAREMPHYKRYRVLHPRGRYQPTADGIARKLSLRSVKVWEAAWYFSAYSVAEPYIDAAEQLLIRVMPNDVLNKRMEGNSSLQMHVEIEAEA